MNWVKSRLAILFEVSHSPDLAFARCLSGPSYLVPFIILGCLFVCVSLLQAPVQVDWMEYRMKLAGMPAEQIATSLSLMQRSNRVGTILIPATLLLRWSALALMICLIGQLILDKLGFARALTVVGYSYIPILVRDATVCAVLLLRSTDLRRSADGLNVALGLNLLLPQVSLPWSALAGEFNPFEAWFVALLVIGITAATRARWTRALAVVLPVWVFVTLVKFGFVSLGFNLQNQFTRGID